MANDDGRDRQVERVVAAGAALLVELVDRLGEQVEGGVVVEVARHEADALGQRAPDLLAERRAGLLADRLVDDLAEVLVGPVAPGEADQREARRQQAAVGEVVDRRHQLLAGEVAGDPEDHQPARARRCAAAACRGGRAAGWRPAATRAGLTPRPRPSAARHLRQAGVVRR